MKQFSCHIITFILLFGCLGFYQEFVEADAVEVEIHGQIGGNEVTVPSSDEPKAGQNIKLAQPKQSHIELRSFPNTGEMIEAFTPIGLLLLVVYLLLSRWKAHRNKCHKK